MTEAPDVARRGSSTSSRRRGHDHAPPPRAAHPRRTPCQISRRIPARIPLRLHRRKSAAVRRGRLHRSDIITWPLERQKRVVQPDGTSGIARRPNERDATSPHGRNKEKKQKPNTKRRRRIGGAATGLAGRKPRAKVYCSMISTPTCRCTVTYTCRPVKCGRPAASMLASRRLFS